MFRCKLVHGSLEQTIRAAWRRPAAYLDRCAAGEGHLVVFDRTLGKPWDEKVFRREATGGVPVTVWGM